MNNFLKKAICLMLVLALAVPLAACGKKNDDPDTDEMLDAINGAEDMMDQIGEENADVEIGNYVLVDESSFEWEATEAGAVLTKYTGTETTIELPAQVGGLDLVMLGNNAFTGTAVVAVKLPDTVKKLDYSCFFYVGTLVKIELGNGLEEISDSCFEGCAALTSIDLPESLRTIGWMAFTWCPFQSITLPANLQNLGKGVFTLCAKLESITIPGSVTTIREQLCTSCDSLKTVVIEPGVTTIEYGAFESCHSLESVYIPDTVTEMSINTFTNSKDKLTIYAPAGSYAQSFAEEWEIPFKVSD